MWLYHVNVWSVHTLLCAWARDQFIQKWAEDLLREQSVRGQGGNSKLRTYRIFKHSFELQPYLINKLYQRLELQWQYYLRVVIHWQLKQEGSINPALSQSLIGYICLVVEDECHFLFLCPKYSLIRLQMESTVLRVKDIFLHTTSCLWSRSSYSYSATLTL